VYNKKNLKKNILSEKERKVNEKLLKRVPLFFIAILYIIAFLQFTVRVWGFDETIYSTVMNNFYIFLFTVLFPLSPLVISLLTWFSNILNPKYISWDKKGIYIKNQRGKEEFIPWGKVKDVKWVEEYGSIPDEYPTNSSGSGFLMRLVFGKDVEVFGEYPDYVIEVKDEGRKRNVNEEIGKELKEYFENIRDEIEPVPVPFYKKGWFKFLTILLISIVIGFILGYWVYKLA